MPFDDAAKESALDHLAGEITLVSLHDGDPGAGASNEVVGGGYQREEPSFASADGDDLTLSENLEFSTPPDQDISWFAVWAGATRYGKGEITSGDTSANAAGEYELTTGTKLSITDPSS